jgi:hypothetical protein
LAVLTWSSVECSWLLALGVYSFLHSVRVYVFFCFFFFFALYFCSDPFFLPSPTMSDTKKADELVKKAKEKMDSFMSFFSDPSEEAMEMYASAAAQYKNAKACTLASAVVGTAVCALRILGVCRHSCVWTARTHNKTDMCCIM